MQDVYFSYSLLYLNYQLITSGELMTGSYKDEETGKNMRTVEVTANRLEFADSKETGPVPSTDEDVFMNMHLWNM